MKRIEFIAPVEAMRGNLSGDQTLEYPLNDNPAFEAPQGKHYATNYQPRYIGAKRASNGLKYFAVKTRSAINITAASTLAMATLGAAGAIIGAILADKSSALYIALQDAYATAKPTEDGRAISFRKWLSNSYIQQLKAKFPILFVTYNNGGTPAIVSLNNPFVSGGTAQYDVTISNDVLVKFWNVLANNPITFTIGAVMGIAHSGDTWGDVIDGHYNVLGVSTGAEPYTSAVMLGDKYVAPAPDDGTENTDFEIRSLDYVLQDEYHSQG